MRRKYMKKSKEKRKKKHIAKKIPLGEAEDGVAIENGFHVYKYHRDN